MVINAWQAILLGLVQGLTEFLPVSSSGHLVIAQALLGIEADVLTFDVFVHVGTLVAVCVAYWQDILALLKRPICRFVGLILVACIPTGLFGLFLNDLFTGLFSNLVAVACALILTGILLFLSDRMDGQKTVEQMSVGNALFIGFMQGLAITPGLSRSGTTIFSALSCGVRREEAARFSFILSIPVILAAALLEAKDLIGSAATVEWTYFLGAAVAALSGFFAIRVFLKLLKRRSMRYFSYYVWALAIIVLVSRLFA